VFAQAGAFWSDKKGEEITMPPQDAYLESQVLSADPIELVRLLYRGALDATRTARVHLAANRIAERARQITKAHAILSHLSGSLDRTRGGTLSSQLAELYDYMQRRLLEANRSQEAAPLSEVERLLTTLLEGWEQIRAAPDNSTAQVPLPQADGEKSQPYGGYANVFTQGQAPEYASQSWSL
jgi:flagellar protein FliS